MQFVSKNFVLTIIHEDTDLLVINKPAGLVCHPTKGDEFSSLISRARLYLNCSLSAACGGEGRGEVVHSTLNSDKLRFREHATTSVSRACAQHSTTSQPRTTSPA